MFGHCRRDRLVLAACSALSLVGCGGSTPADNTGGAGDIQATASLQFLPPQKTVALGTQVTWDFGAVAHTVVFDEVTGHPANITSATANTTVARSFGTLGTFPYHCTIHPGMTGTVQVVSSGAGMPAPPPPPPPGPVPGYP